MSPGNQVSATLLGAPGILFRHQTSVHQGNYTEFNFASWDFYFHTRSFFHFFVLLLSTRRALPFLSHFLVLYLFCFCFGIFV